MKRTRDTWSNCFGTCVQQTRGFAERSRWCCAHATSGECNSPLVYRDRDVPNRRTRSRRGACATRRCRDDSPAVGKIGGRVPAWAAPARPGKTRGPTPGRPLSRFRSLRRGVINKFKKMYKIDWTASHLAPKMGIGLGESSPGSGSESGRSNPIAARRVLCRMVGISSRNAVTTASWACAPASASNQRGASPRTGQV